MPEQVAFLYKKNQSAQWGLTSMYKTVMRYKKLKCVRLKLIYTHIYIYDKRGEQHRFEKRRSKSNFSRANRISRISFQQKQKVLYAHTVSLGFWISGDRYISFLCCAVFLLNEVKCINVKVQEWAETYSHAAAKVSDLALCAKTPTGWRNSAWERINTIIMKFLFTNKFWVVFE